MHSHVSSAVFSVSTVAFAKSVPVWVIFTVAKGSCSGVGVLPLSLLQPTAARNGSKSNMNFVVQRQHHSDTVVHQFGILSILVEIGLGLSVVLADVV